VKVHLSLLVRAAALLLPAGRIHAQDGAATPAAIEGCYRADRALGTSAASANGRAIPGEVGRRIGEDSAAMPRLATFRLLPDGRTARPGLLMADDWERGSLWSLDGDTLRVRLSTGMSGWALRLVRSPGEGDGSYVGVARYLTDVVVVGWRAPEAVVSVRRERCIPPA
jgi:hypothetical protein